MKPTTEEVLADAVGTVEAWLPGYTDGSPQRRVNWLGDDLYRYEPVRGTDETWEPVLFRIRVTVEEVGE